MSEADNTVNIDNLDDFAKELFRPSGKEVVDVKAEEPVADTTETDIDEDLDADLVAEDDSSTETATEDDDDGQPEEPKKKNRKNFQERIDELTAARKEAERQAERDRADYQRRLAELEAKLNQPAQPKVEEKAPEGAPDPTAMTDKGEPVYALGEYDPAYLRDLAKFEVKREMQAAEQYRQQREAEAAQTQARETQRLAWVDKLSEAEQELPDIREKINTLEPVLGGVNPQYAQYLVDVVMSLENGPQVLHYLANEPKEARDIVNAGIASATVRLGRLDARMSKPVKNEEAPKKVTKAPEPPKKVTRGTGGQFSVRDDTDDLDAFARVYFNK